MKKDIFSTVIYDFSHAVVLSFTPALRIIRHPHTDRDSMMRSLKIKGGAVIIANHTSFKDPLLLTIAFWRRRVSYIAAETVLKNKIARWLLLHTGCIEVNRNIFDFACVKKSIEVLKSGTPVVMFPEGGMTKNEHSSFKSGMTLMAAQAGVPIIPVYIAPNKGIMHMIHMVIGEPIDVSAMCGGSPMPSKAILDDITAAVERREEDLKQTYENKYAKRKDK